MIPDKKAFNDKRYFEHEGVTYYRYYTFNKQHTKVKIEVISTNSPCKQGIAICTSVDPLFKGKILFKNFILLFIAVLTIGASGCSCFNKQETYSKAGMSLDQNPVTDETWENIKKASDLFSITSSPQGTTLDITIFMEVSSES